MRINKDKMTRAFKVAGHVFHLTMADACGIWKYLTQYEPFACEPAGAPLFGLELVESFPEAPSQMVYDAPTEDGQTVIRMARRESGEWHIEMSPDHKQPTKALMLASPDFRKADIVLTTRNVRDALFGINNAMMLLYAFTTATLGTLEMHASVVAKEGKGYLFLGKSGTGKSTHSNLWLKHIDGTELVNDDNPIVRVHENGSIVVYGSPWSGKTPCYRNVEFPVGAFVRIRQHPKNKIARMSLPEAYASIYSSCSGFKAMRQMADGLHETMAAVVTSTPCYVLDCRPDEEAAIVCTQTVLQ